MANSSKSLVIFDFDGVIANSMGAVVSTYQQADPSFTMADYSDRFRDNTNKPKAPLNRDDFFTKYESIAPNLPIMDGIAEAIIQLAKNYTLTINSSGNTTLMKRFLKNHNLKQHFADILGFDIATSKIEKINTLLKKHEVEINQCVMITDTLGDLHDASEANIKTIAVTWGLHDSATLQEGHATATVNHPSQLPKQIHAILEDLQ